MGVHSSQMNSFLEHITEMQHKRLKMGATSRLSLCLHTCTSRAKEDQHCSLGVCWFTIFNQPMYQGTSTIRKGEPNDQEKVRHSLAASASLHVDRALEPRGVSHPLFSSMKLN